MAAKLVVLYGAPENADEFDQHYRDVHAPMVNTIVDVQRWDYAKVVGAPDGGEVPYYLIAELYFTDPTALQAALTSAEGKAVAADYQSFAPPGSRMFVAELTTE